MDKSALIFGKPLSGDMVNKGFYLPSTQLYFFGTSGYLLHNTF